MMGNAHRANLLFVILASVSTYLFYV